MTSLAETLHDDMIAAMRERDDIVLRTLRMTVAAVKTEEVAGKRPRQLTDADVVVVLGREAKKRREAAEAFSTAGRTELAARELEEAEVLDRYLPAQLTDAELTDLVAEAIAETGAEGPRGLGLVMKAVGSTTAGRADGSRVSAEARRQLG